MNPIILRAMFEDARQQVLDNKVFRLLIILTGIPILFTFLIGFQEDHISLLWGFKEIPYEDLLQNLGGAQLGTDEVSVAFIQGIQGIFLSVFAGMFGMMLCIAATAFFAPRILEKGAADTVFSKPVSRMTVLMSRYLAGILFVAFISVVLVLGMYFGFLIVSGYNDPGFLWGALTLVYLYAMMHAFSICVAVWTRSSTAAILLTIFLFMICGAVHGGWIGYKYYQEQTHVSALRSESVSNDESSEGEESLEATEDEEGAEEEGNAVVNLLFNTLEVLHYALPKTSDADMITSKLRRAITEKTPDIETADGDLLVKLSPGGFTLVESSRDKLESTGVEWISDSEGGAADGRVTMRRYKRPEIEKTIGSKTRVSQLTSKDASKTFMEELEALGESPTSYNESISSVRVLNVSWTPIAGGTHNNRLFFHFDDYIYEVEIMLADGTMADEPTSEEAKPSETSDSGAVKVEVNGGGSELMGSHEERRWRRRFLQGGNVVLGQVAGMDPESWYEKRFSWNSELKYNIFFSIGSSLMFILAMLVLAWMRLRKIDF